jgi:hypothetical protein
MIDDDGEILAARWEIADETAFSPDGTWLAGHHDHSCACGIPFAYEPDCREGQRLLYSRATARIIVSSGIEIRLFRLSRAASSYCIWSIRART